MSARAPLPSESSQPGPAPCGSTTLPSETPSQVPTVPLADRVDVLDTQHRAIAEEADAAATVSDTAAMSVRMMDAMLFEMLSRLTDLRERSDQSRRVADETRGCMETSRSLVRELETVTKSIRSLADGIDKVAGQTTMLSLNATIEASRAGEAGAGFAVVAKEIKDLARATSSAADAIGDQLRAIGNVTARVANSLTDAESGVENMHQVFVSVADVVSSQEDVVQTVHGFAMEAAECVEGLGATLQQTSAHISEAWESSRTLICMISENDEEKEV